MLTQSFPISASLWRARLFWRVAPLLLLTGCGLPPVVTAISFAADGVSYASSGRSVTDHAVSVAADQDCALLRVVDGKPICRKFRKGEETEMVLAAREWAAGSEVIGANDYEGAGFVGDSAAGKVPGGTRVAIAKTNLKPATVSSPRPAGLALQRRKGRAVDLVTGSYRRLEYAQVKADRLAHLDPMVVRVALPSGTYYRVVLRAHGTQDRRNQGARLRAEGVKYWTAPACRAAGCILAGTGRRIGADPS